MRTIVAAITTSSFVELLLTLLFAAIVAAALLRHPALVRIGAPAATPGRPARAARVLIVRHIVTCRRASTLRVTATLDRVT